MSVVEFITVTASVLLYILTFPISVFLSFKIVQEFERAVIFRLGRLRSGEARGPGLFFVLPCVDNYCKVDLRTVSFDVPPQEALTKDAVTVNVDAVVYYRIQEPLKAITAVEDYSNSTRLLAMTTLRNVLGTRNLADILSDREAISHFLQETLDLATDPWGIKVERVEIKDVSVPHNLQRAMAAEAEASREARAKVIAAEGEMKASRALREAAEVISDNPTALQLRYLQTLSNISSEKSSTIIFPIPMDLVTPFLNHGKRVCDHGLLFTDVYAGEAGSIHDYTLFKRSDLFARIRQQNAFLCDDTHLLGDLAYKLDTNLIENVDIMGAVEFITITASSILFILTLPISVFLSFKIVQEFERAVIFRLGRLKSGGARGPGLFFVLPCVDTYCKVDLRTISFGVPPQEALTKDAVTVNVDAVVYYRIHDPLKAITAVENYSNSTRLLAMTSLRNILGTRNLAEILSDREAISQTLQETLDVATEPWGVKVERVEIKDVSVPHSLQRAMAAEAEASREARAKVIAAEGEMKASRALREASEVISDNPTALQLRYLQTLSNISSEKNSTIIFPIPMELITPFLHNGKSIP